MSGTSSYYIVAGPTASGKSDFAHNLAKRLGGIVINCDSVQVYRGIENISASPFAEHNSKTMDNIDGVPYRLFSTMDLTMQLNVAEYLELARTEYNAAMANGTPVVFVGGTGYYINALIHGISPIPEISADNRKRAREIVAKNPESARALLTDEFTPSDPQRTARALEVFLETGRPLTEWQQLPRRGALNGTPIKIFVNPSRDILAERIAARIPQMIANGALAEAKNVMTAGWDESRAIGAAQACKFLRGEISETDMIENWATRTNQYAKRQRTWFRHQFNADFEIPRIPTDKDLENVLSK